MTSAYPPVADPELHQSSDAHVAGSLSLSEVVFEQAEAQPASAVREDPSPEGTRDIFTTLERGTCPPEAVVPETRVEEELMREPASAEGLLMGSLAQQMGGEQEAGALPPLEPGRLTFYRSSFL